MGTVATYRLLIPCLVTATSDYKFLRLMQGTLTEGKGSEQLTSSLR